MNKYLEKIANHHFDLLAPLVGVGASDPDDAISGTVVGTGAGYLAGKLAHDRAHPMLSGVATVAGAYAGAKAVGKAKDYAYHRDVVGRRALRNQIAELRRIHNEA